MFPVSSQVALVVKNPSDNARNIRDRIDLWVGQNPWRRAWQPTPVFLSGKSHGQRILRGYHPWCRKRVGHGWSDSALTHAKVFWSINPMQFLFLAWKFSTAKTHPKKGIISEVILEIMIGSMGILSSKSKSLLNFILLLFTRPAHPESVMLDQPTGGFFPQWIHRRKLLWNPLQSSGPDPHCCGVR